MIAAWLVAVAVYQWPTLLQAIGTAHAPPPRANIANLDKRITSYAWGRDGHNYVFGYYIDSGAEELLGPLWIAEFDATRESWLQRSYSYGEPPIGKQGLGSVLSIFFSGPYLYAVLHYTPSATNTLQFSRDLTYRHSYYGWPLAPLSNGFWLYHNSMVHFAQTHPARVSVFDPASGQSRQIFPPDPSAPLQADWYGREAQAYARCGQAWFRDHNLPEDPGWADRAVVDWASNPVTDSAAISVIYSNEGFTCAVPKPGDLALIYVYLHPENPKEMQYREMQDPAPHGSSTAQLEQLLSRDSIKRMFKA